MHHEGAPRSASLSGLGGEQQARLAQDLVGALQFGVARARHLLLWLDIARQHPRGDGRRIGIGGAHPPAKGLALDAEVGCDLADRPAGSMTSRLACSRSSGGQRDYLNAAGCMRAYGITNVPDPAFSGVRISLAIPSSSDTRPTQVTQAKQTCRQLIPAGLPASGRSG